MNTRKRHPVWDVYDEFRTARLNTIYYRGRLNRLRRANSWVELVLALSISTGVAGLWFWETTTGGIIWKIFATIAAFLTAAKPIIKLSGRIQKQNETFTNWRLMDSEFKRLVMKINQYRKYDDGMRNHFFTLLETETSIINNEPDEVVDQKLNEKCYNQVNKELPLDDFFVPEE